MKRPLQPRGGVVKPYVKENKNAANDAEATCEAVVPVKSAEQEDGLALHRVRSGLVKERTAQANRLHGLLGEYGIVVGKGLAQLRKRLPEILEDAKNDLSALVRALFADLHGRISALDQQVAAYGARLKALNEADEVCRAIGQVPGVGPITATATAASLGDG